MDTEITITSTEAAIAMAALYRVASSFTVLDEGESDALIAVADALSDADRIVIEPEE